MATREQIEYWQAYARGARDFQGRPCHPGKTLDDNPYSNHLATAWREGYLDGEWNANDPLLQAALDSGKLIIIAG